MWWTAAAEISHESAAVAAGVVSAHSSKEIQTQRLTVEIIRKALNYNEVTVGACLYVALTSTTNTILLFDHTYLATRARETRI